MEMRRCNHLLVTTPLDLGGFDRVYEHYDAP